MSDDGTGAIVGEQFWPPAEIMEIAVDAWEKPPVRNTEI